MSIRLIVGLGNPGREYARTRHNAGFWWAERCASELRIGLQAESRFFGLTGRSQGNAPVHVLLPQTFMNACGKSVGSLVRFYRFEPEEILVVHDELDLLPGVARFKFGGGHGGHNGLKDIVATLGSPQFWRLRLGIGHPGHRDAVAAWVLNVPRADDAERIESALERSLLQLPNLLRGDFSAAMRELHGSEV